MTKVCTIIFYLTLISQAGLKNKARVCPIAGQTVHSSLKMTEGNKTIQKKVLLALEDEGWINYNFNDDGKGILQQAIVLKSDHPDHQQYYRGTGWYWGTLKMANFLMQDAKCVEFAAGFVTKKNAGNYRYRIILNDSRDLFGWKVPEIFRTTNDGQGTYAYLGKIASKPGQTVQIEIYNIKNYQDRNALIVDWRKPKKLNCWVTLQYRDKSDKHEMQSASLGADRRVAKSKWNFIETDTLSNVKFRLGDSLLRIQFRSQNLSTPYNYQVVLRKKNGNYSGQMDLGECNDHFELYKEFWDKPGFYTVTFAPVLLKHHGGRVVDTKNKWSYSFTVMEAKNAGKLFDVKELTIIILLLSATVGGMFWFVVSKLKRSNFVKLNHANRQKEIAREQLQGIRSQLNPHFVFNALAGIQNLINKHEFEAANLYLGKFSRVTRTILVNQDTITLKEEKTLLEDYLIMEQLRFGFQFNFSVDDDLEMENIQIPAMLFQTFVENAVKHGIADLRSRGIITVTFRKKDSDLVFILSDNGRGFDPSKDYQGFGLRLSKNRLSLLNDIYRDSPIELEIDVDQGTVITITLHHWL